MAVHKANGPANRPVILGKKARKKPGPNREIEQGYSKGDCPKTNNFQGFIAGFPIIKPKRLKRQQKQSHKATNPHRVPNLGLPR